MICCLYFCRSYCILDLWQPFLISYSIAVRSRALKWAHIVWKEILISGHTVQWNAIDLKLRFGCGCNLRERINQLTSAGATLVGWQLWQAWVYWVTMLISMRGLHLAFVCTAHSETRNRWAVAVQLKGREGAGAVATEFVQTLQCVAFVIENCRTRESAVSPNLWAKLATGFSSHAPTSASPLQLSLNPCGLRHVATLAAASRRSCRQINQMTLLCKERGTVERVFKVSHRRLKCN